MAPDGPEVRAAKLAAEPHAPADGDEESPFKSTGGAKRVLNAARYSMRGLVFAWRVESAFRQELSLALVLVPTALLLPVSVLEKLALVASVVIVLIVELVNSSIEAAIDRISLDPHRLSGRAKDLGSAAVFLALGLCALTWGAIAGPVLATVAAGWR
jgi:diacylglycerol kinase (ATP)